MAPRRGVDLDNFLPTIISVAPSVHPSDNMSKHAQRVSDDGEPGGNINFVDSYKLLPHLRQTKEIESRVFISLFSIFSLPFDFIRSACENEGMPISGPIW